MCVCVCARACVCMCVCVLSLNPTHYVQLPVHGHKRNGRFSACGGRGEGGGGGERINMTLKTKHKPLQHRHEGVAPTPPPSTPHPPSQLAYLWHEVKEYCRKPLTTTRTGDFGNAYRYNWSWRHLLPVFPKNLLLSPPMTSVLVSVSFSNADSPFLG